MEPEPLNQSTDVVEDESQVIFKSPALETSDKFLDCSEKKSEHVLKLKSKFNTKAAKISQAQKPQFPIIKNEG